MIAEVIVDIANSQVDKVFDYIALESTKPGDRVLVPFGPKLIEGFVIKLKEKSDYDQSKLKQIAKSLDDEPLILPEMLALSDFLVKQNHLKKVDTLRLFLPSGIRKNKIKPLKKQFLVTNNFSKTEIEANLRKNSKNQFALLEFLKPNQVYEKAELNKTFGQSAVQKFLELGVFCEQTQKVERKPQILEKKDNKVVLNEQQQQILNKLEIPKTHLIFGVTGSGKTEIYMHAIKKVLAQGKTAIMLVPEIGLTPQVVGLFKARFGESIAILHSGLSMGERFDEWQRIRFNQAKIVVGARSAIFAPLQNLGIIVIDEEHDGSYKSDTNPRFLTHDVAIFRANFNGCPLVLGSATPSVESFEKAKRGEYMLHTLLVRANKKDMPKVEIVDMRQEMLEGNTGLFSKRLLNDLSDTIKAKNQAMIFCNRRGFASYLICKECGWTAKCEDCDVTLVYHKQENMLKCHFCNRRYKALTNCPNCNSTYIKMGTIGTEKVVMELQNIFPDTKILRMDFDTTQTKFAHAQILEEFASTKPCILVGTQMIAKGHDFPNVTLVGIVDADMSLHYADFRSTERTFDLLTQVAGRAGRADKIGKIVLQTYMPKHYVYRFMANYDYPSFFEREIGVRKLAKFPPFAYIVRVLLSSENQEIVRETTANLSQEFSRLYKEDKDILFCQAMKSPVSKIQTKFRYQILLRFSISGFQRLIEKTYELVDKFANKNVLTFVEINPNNLS